MVLDLSALEDNSSTITQSGKPLLIPLQDIEEDPHQPRKEFSPEAMDEMIESIRERGVKTPVSVRVHPDKPGKWILNYGARRFRGSHGAEKADIPAFIDEAHEDYDQVVENLHREDLKPMELALFIKKRMDAGDKQAVIARKLGKGREVITHHLTLLDLPNCIEDVYGTGRCTSAKTLYELKNIYGKYPDEVAEWCSSEVEVTRRTVSELAGVLQGKNKPAETLSANSNVEQHNNVLPEGTTNVSDGNAVSSNVTENNNVNGTAGKNDASSAPTKDGKKEQEPKDNGELTSWPKGHAVSDPHRMSKPLLLVDIDGRSAAVILNRRPTEPGLMHVRFDDGGGDMEISVSRCKITMLSDG